MTSSTKRVVLVVVIAIVAASVTAYVVFQSGNSATQTSSTSTSDSSADPATPGPDAAVAVVNVIQSFPDDPLGHTSSAMQDTVSADLETVLPAGSTLNADPESWQPVGTDSGSIVMTMQVPGESEPRVYLAFLVLEDGDWKLDGTVESEATS